MEEYHVSNLKQALADITGDNIPAFFYILDRDKEFTDLFNNIINQTFPDSTINIHHQSNSSMRRLWKENTMVIVKYISSSALSAAIEKGARVLLVIVSTNEEIILKELTGQITHEKRIEIKN